MQVEELHNKLQEAGTRVEESYAEGRKAEAQLEEAREGLRASQTQAEQLQAGLDEKSAALAAALKVCQAKTRSLPDAMVLMTFETSPAVSHG